MRDGWYNDEYWSLCEDQSEAEKLTASYVLGEYIPGYFIVGLKGWDDFILTNSEGCYFLVPTVPLELESLSPFTFPAESLRLEPDERFSGKFKWYVKPLRFGGSPSEKKNMVWLSQGEHVRVVMWWNTFYRETLSKRQKTSVKE